MHPVRFKRLPTVSSQQYLQVKSPTVPLRSKGTVSWFGEIKNYKLCTSNIQWHRLESFITRKWNGSKRVGIRPNQEQNSARATMKSDCRIPLLQLGFNPHSFMHYLPRILCSSWFTLCIPQDLALLFVTQTVSLALAAFILYFPQHLLHIPGIPSNPVSIGV